MNILKNKIAKRPNNILVVDHLAIGNELIHGLLAQFDKDNFYNIYKVGSGNQLLNIYKYQQNNNIACIFARVESPLLSGIELVKELKKINHNTPIFLYTSDSHYQRKCLVELVCHEVIQYSLKGKEILFFYCGIINNRVKKYLKLKDEVTRLSSIMEFENNRLI